MKYFKLSFYIEAETLQEAYLKLEDKISSAGDADTEQEITKEQFDKFV